MKRIVSHLTIWLLLPFALCALETEKSLSLTGSTVPELQLSAACTIIQPALRGDGLLTAENNLALKIEGDLTPISAGAGVTASVTPLALLEFSAGAYLGSGWSLPFDGLDGLRLSSAAGTAPIEEDSLGGLYYALKTGGKFMFDLGAVLPGDWNHIVTSIYQEINYTAYTGASGSELWEYRLTGGRVNGANHYANYFLGYNMPLKMNLVGLLFETDTYDLGGSVYEETFYTFSLYGGIALNASLSLSLIPQWGTAKTDDDTGYKSDEGLKWNRFIAVLNWKR